MNLTVDVLVIGFGTAGKLIAARMGRNGARVAMVEQSDQMYGGTCINIGCVPTKSLVHLAETHDPEADPGDSFRDAAQRTKHMTARMRARNYGTLESIDAVTIITGHASFVDAHNVMVATHNDTLVITADVIVIDAGSEPVIPDIVGVGSSIHTYTSTGLLANTERPPRLAIIGGGGVGVEFASVHSQFCTAVTILEQSEALFGLEDDDVAASATELLEQAGVTIRTSARVIKITDHSRSATILYSAGGVVRSVEAEAILIAVGRVPSVLGLGLSNAGVSLTSRGAIAVDEYLRTSQSHIYAVGDVNGGPQFTYIAHDDGRIVLDHLAGTGTRSTADREALPYTVFLSPPLARVGLTEREARAQGRAIDVMAMRVADLADMPRSEIVGDTRGLIKFVVDAGTDEILGAALLCVDAQELINLVALAMRTHVTATALRDSIFTHPSSSEAIGEVLGSRQPVTVPHQAAYLLALSEHPA